MEDHIVPPSGEWSGFYLQNGERNYFTMHLYFSTSSTRVHGQCTDDEVLNSTKTELIHEFAFRETHIVEVCPTYQDRWKN